MFLGDARTREVLSYRAQAVREALRLSVALREPNLKDTVGLFQDVMARIDAVYTGLAVSEGGRRRKPRNRGL